MHKTTSRRLFSLLLPLSLILPLLATGTAGAADAPPPKPAAAAPAQAAPPAPAKRTTKLGQCSADAKKKGLKGADRKKFVSECTKAS